MNRLFPEHPEHKGFVLDEKIKEYEERIHNFDVGFQIGIIQERFKIVEEYQNKLKQLKKEIKTEIKSLGIKLPPGSPLRELLNGNPF